MKDLLTDADALVSELDPVLWDGLDFILPLIDREAFQQPHGHMEPFQQRQDEGRSIIAAQV